ncbi:uracil phosphoribosyltransferase [Candidatus Dependentiae bacterium]
MEHAKQIFMTILRDKKTSRPKFRQASNRLANILAHEAAAHLSVKKTSIETPIDSATGITFANPIVLVPILRSGITLLHAFLHYFENATVGVVGLKRDEETAQAHWYYENLPPLTGKEQIIILDPMIATGGTGVETLRKLKEHGITQDRILFVSVVCAPEGLEAIRAEFPDIKIITVAIDDHLNAKKFIVPGLGDFGDRYFGTE